MDRESIEGAVKSAITDLITFDHDMLEIDANERAISHRLAVYLEKKICGWNIDCEYNRDLSKPKGLPRKLLEEADTNNEFDCYKNPKKKIIPDIIVHKRRTFSNNLLVIEIKTSSNYAKEDADFDKRKLMAFRKNLNYDYALFLLLCTGSKFSSNLCKNYTIEWI